MNQSLEKSLHYLTGNGNITEVNKEELEKICLKYPYFSVAHLLLAKKLKASIDVSSNEQIIKTSLFSPDPYWLHYQVEGDKDELDFALDVEERLTETSELTAVTLPEELPDTPHDVPITTEFSVDELVESDKLARETLAEGSELPATAHEDHYIENIKPTVEKTAFEAEEITLPEELENVAHDVLITTEFSVEELNESDKLARETLAEGSELPATAPEDLYIENIEPAVEKTALETEEITLPEELDNVAHDVPITTEFSIDELVESDKLARETLAEGGELPAIAVTTTNNVSLDENIPEKAEPSKEVELQRAGIQAEEEAVALSRDEPDEVTEAFLEEVVHAEETPRTAEEDEADDTEGVLSEKATTESLDEHDQMFQNIKAMLDATSEDINAPTYGSIIPIDPYHTIDYFASQGIKLELEANPKDELGKNLKKFTQWLKHMKKLGPEDALETIESRQAEASIQQIADSSNTVREVVTEAMAQVLEKQGKKEKAIQLYNKLSFLNPHKSAYFADKIKNLKGI